MKNPSRFYKLRSSQAAAAFFEEEFLFKDTDSYRLPSSSTSKFSESNFNDAALRNPSGEIDNEQVSSRPMSIT